TGNFDIFKTLSSNPQPNHSSQVTVFQQVSICITADGCAFYTISHPLQACWTKVFIAWLYFEPKRI
ncbi:hypothetical protein KPE71_10205, partial [Acinetobacter soli]|nr:hypothetical protein [Acinetobacter soli]